MRTKKENCSRIFLHFPILIKAFFKASKFRSAVDVHNGDSFEELPTKIDLIFNWLLFLHGQIGFSIFFVSRGPSCPTFAICPNFHEFVLNRPNFHQNYPNVPAFHNFQISLNKFQQSKFRPNIKIIELEKRNNWTTFVSIFCVLVCIIAIWICQNPRGKPLT